MCRSVWSLCLSVSVSVCLCLSVCKSLSLSSSLSLSLSLSLSHFLLWIRSPTHQPSLSLCLHKYTQTAFILLPYHVPQPFYFFLSCVYALMKSRMAAGIAVFIMRKLPPVMVSDSITDYTSQPFAYLLSLLLVLHHSSYRCCCCCCRCSATLARQ